MILIILGGLGFAVLTNLNKWNPLVHSSRDYRRKLTVSTKIVLSVTFILIFVGSIFIFLTESFEFDSGLTFAEKIYHSIFLSVSCRTAGFNTMPTEQLSYALIIITLPLMWIGASPGSTGGGIKTTTIGITLLGLYHTMKGKEKIEIFDREIHQRSIRKAFMVILSSLIFLGIGSFLLIWVEPDKQPINLIFEAASAIGTVGLTRDVTSHLGTGGKLIVIFLMFVGRIGVLTFFLAFVRSAVQPRYTLPKTDIVVG